MSVNNNIIRNSALVQTILSPEFELESPAESQPVLAENVPVSGNEASARGLQKIWQNFCKSCAKAVARVAPKSAEKSREERIDVLAYDDDYKPVSLGADDGDDEPLLGELEYDDVVVGGSTASESLASDNDSESLASDQVMVNKRALTGRVKKLNQSERRALMDELKHISSLLKSETKVKSADLREKGLCVLLLKGDGLPVQANRVISSFILGICNIFWRVSSASLVEKIAQVREELQEQGYSYTNEFGDGRVEDDNIKEHLQLRKTHLNAKLEKIDENVGRINALKGEVKKLWDGVIKLKESCNDEELIPILVKIADLKHKIRNDEQSAYVDLGKKLSEVERFLIAPSTKRDLAEMNINLAICALREGYEGLDKELQSADRKKAQIQNEIQPIHKHLKQLKKHEKVQKTRAKCEAAFNVEEKAEMLWRGAAKFASYVEQLQGVCQNLEKDDRKSKDKLRTLKFALVDTIPGQIDRSEDIPVGNKAEMLSLLGQLNRVLKFTAATPDEFHEAVTTLDQALDTRCCNEQKNPEFQKTFNRLRAHLQGMAPDEHRYGLNTNSDKIEFASDYIAYLKILTQALASDAKEALERATAESNRLENKMETLVGGNAKAAWTKRFSFTALFPFADPLGIMPLGVMGESIIGPQVEKLFRLKAPSPVTSTTASSQPGESLKSVIHMPLPYTPKVDSDSDTDSEIDMESDSDADIEPETDSDEESDIGASPALRETRSPFYDPKVRITPPLPQSTWNPWSNAEAGSGAEQLWDPYSPTVAITPTRENTESLKRIASDLKKAFKNEDWQTAKVCTNNLRKHALYPLVYHNYRSIMAEWGNQRKLRLDCLIMAMENAVAGLRR